MSIKKQIVVKDACIFFDLLDLNLIDSFYHLDIVVCTTSYVIQEVTDNEQMEVITLHVQNGNLIVDDTGALEDILEISSQYRGLSFTDSSVLELANRKGFTVLSSDGSLRKISEKSGLQVCGMLWVIEELRKADLITLELALEKLDQYPKINKRAAPKTLIEELIHRLKNS